MVVDRSFWLTVWWLTVLAIGCAVAVFLLHLWRDGRRRPAPNGRCFYLDEDAVMDLYHQVQFRSALEEEVEEQFTRERDHGLRAQVYGGAEAWAGRRFNEAVLRRYVRTFEPITVIGTIVNALEAADGVVHVHLRRRRIEQNRALRNALSDNGELSLFRRPDVRLGELGTYLSISGRFRCAGPTGDTTILLAPYGDPADPTTGPQIRADCVTAGLRGTLSNGTFQARCLGRVEDWDPAEQQLVIRPLAIFH